MAKPPKTAISPTRTEDYPEWYQQVIKAADMAETSPVRGCMIIKPWGYAIWENMQRILDKEFKKTGHKNAYFPLFIPKSFLEKEAEHVEGFAKECAVVTHSRLEASESGLQPASELEEPLVVRPTSETIIGDAFARWVESYRDLPLLINQWANVVRWEMRTRLFLRTSEFLWQEGHTAHATSEEAVQETNKMLQVYADFANHSMAVPVITGQKTEAERFPGAVDTFCIEAMMQDKKALQAGTSHFLGQNFAKAANISFSTEEKGDREFAWTTSWGVSTRLIGALLMTHSDDDGLVLPPKLAPVHVVIVPVLNKEETKAQVLEYCEKLKSELDALDFDRRPIEVELDTRDIRGGDKKWEWIKKGVPVRIEVGPRDIESDSLFVGRRDKGIKEAYGQPRAEFIEKLPALLQEIQDGLYQKALKFREENTHKIDSKEDFYKFFTPKNANKPEIHGGFAFSHWCGDIDIEEQIKKDLKVTIRCIPDSMEKEEGVCIFTGKPSPQRVVFAKAY